MLAVNVVRSLDRRAHSKDITYQNTKDFFINAVLTNVDGEMVRKVE